MRYINDAKLAKNPNAKQLRIIIIQVDPHLHITSFISMINNFKI